MGKSLTEAARAVLMKEEGVPSVSPMDAGHPDRDAKNITPNKATLRPGSGYSDAKPIVNPGSTPPKDDVDDLGGQTPTSGAPTKNLGAEAAGKTSKDTSKAATSAVAGEPAKSLSEDEEVDADVVEEDIEISEELEAFINEMMDKGLSEEEIAQAIEENFEVVEEDAEELAEKSHEGEKEKEEPGEKKHHEGKKEEEAEKRKEMMKEHVNALLEGENLSEEFRTKAETIFESAVNTRVNEELQTLEEAYAQSLEEEVEKIRNELSEQVDDYLNYVVEQWVSENEVAIESGLRSEITEDFISGLRNLFAEHYIDIPEEKVSVIDELGTKVEELEAKLNEEIERNVALNKTINEAKKFETLVKACDGLTTTQAEKLKTLAESVEFSSVEEFANKVKVLKENYFQTTVKSDKVLDTTDDSGKNLIAEETTGRMSAYVKALGTKLPK